MHPIRIVRILGRLNIGGPAVHAVLLTEGLNDQRYHSTLVTGMIGESEGDMRYFAEQHGIVPHVIPELGRDISWKDDIVALWKVYSVLIRERPQIVHTHTAKAGTLGRIAALLARVPIRIHTFHGHIFDGYFSPFMTKLFIVIERMLAYFTTKIVAISNAQLTALSGRYRISSREKFAVIPLGLDLAALRGIQRKVEERKANADHQEAVLGFVGRLVPIKNPHMALTVLEELLRDEVAERQVHWRMIVAGDGAMRAQLEEQVARGQMENRVSFGGWQRDLMEVYSSLDLIVLTSISEGTPVVLIEAMAAGVPFVATKVGGVPDLVFGPEEVVCKNDGRPLFSVFANGVLVESGDVEGFVAAVRYLVKTPHLIKQMGSEGRSFVSHRFSKERLVDDVLSLYRDCLRKNAKTAVAQI